MKRKRRATEIDLKDNLNRFRLLGVIFFLIISTLIVRSFQIQMIKDPRLLNLAKRQFSSNIILRPSRGRILDRNGKPLAINGEAKSLAVNPGDISDKKKLALTISKSIGVSRESVLKKLERDGEFSWIKRHLSPSQLAKLKKNGVIKRGGSTLNGVWLVTEPKRFYPHGDSVSTLLGMVDIDSTGIEGVEHWLNDDLKGEKQRVSTIRDSLGRKTFFDPELNRLDKKGIDVSLTIDFPLQFESHKSLERWIEKTQSESGSVIVLDADNGEILVNANFPTFDPLKRSKSNERRNRGIIDGFEPGSTIKAVLMALALENNWSDKELIYGEKGSLRVGDWVIEEAETHEKFEWMTLADMVEKSSNVVAAKVAMRLGASKILKGLNGFGFGKKVETGFPGELSGWLPEQKNISPIKLANLGFGQGMFTTPLHVARAFSAFVNGGYLVDPVLLIDNSHIKSRNRIISRETSEIVKRALISVVEKGTGQKASIPGFIIGGKTGTAQLVDRESGGYSKSKYFSSFVGFIVEAERNLVILTALRAPKGSYYASETAVPLFREVAEAAVNRFNFLKLKPVAITSEPTVDKIRVSSAAAEKIKILDRIKSVAGKDGVMPDLIGITARESLERLSGKSFRVRMQGFGVVDSQDPVAGSILRDGQDIVLKLKPQVNEESKTN